MPDVRASSEVARRIEEEEGRLQGSTTTSAAPWDRWRPVAVYWPRAYRASPMIQQ